MSATTALRRLAVALGAVALALGFLAGSPGTARAHHEWYLPGQQFVDEGNVPHWTSYVALPWWSGQAATWRSAIGGVHRDRAAAAIASWQNAGVGEFPRMGWAEVGTGETVLLTQSADMMTACGRLEGGCIALDGWWWAEAEETNYITHATVYFDSNYRYPYTDAALEAFYLHEVGHFYGLTDEYPHYPPLQFPQLPPLRASVMGGLVTDLNYPGGPAVIGFSGGVTAPTASDVDRARAYWRGLEPPGYDGVPHWNGRLGNWGLSAPAPLTLRAAYDDFAWAENRHAFELYRVDGPTWQLLTRTEFTGQIGRHRKYSGPYRPVRDFDVAPWGPGQYAVCGVPLYFGAALTGGSGTWTCSPALAVEGAPATPTFTPAPATATFTPVPPTVTPVPATATFTSTPAGATPTAAGTRVSNACRGEVPTVTDHGDGTASYVVKVTSYRGPITRVAYDLRWYNNDTDAVPRQGQIPTQNALGTGGYTLTFSHPNLNVRGGLRVDATFEGTAWIQGTSGPIECPFSYVKWSKIVVRTYIDNNDVLGGPIGLDHAYRRHVRNAPGTLFRGEHLDSWFPDSTPKSHIASLVQNPSVITTSPKQDGGNNSFYRDVLFSSPVPLGYKIGGGQTRRLRVYTNANGMLLTTHPR